MGRMSCLNESTAVWELIRFGLVGLAATGLYIVCTLLLQHYAGLPIAASGTVAFPLVVAVNYVLHRSWTFRSRQPHSVALPRFICTAVGGILINGVTLEAGKLSPSISPVALLVIGVGFVVTWNYFLAKFWVFVDKGRRK